MSDQNNAPTDATVATDDVQGHIRQRATEERDEATSDDVSGHHFRMGADAERDETADDTEGHIAKFGFTADDNGTDEPDDVKGRGWRW